MRQPTNAEWTLISQTFDGLVGGTAVRRRPTLDSMALDPFVRDRVAAMLTAHDRVGVLDAPTGMSPPNDELTGYSSLLPGALIGPFRIERLIGRGGMGEIYLAERRDGGFDQRVALKLLRPEAAGRMDLFDAERRLLAGLEYPGIARIIDGGLAPDGRPYMALEYVDGQAITTWCTARGAGAEQRLRLMLEVCDAVSYAHGRLVIHRDLKPANVLVDQAGRVRLLDFGIAKIIDDAAPEQTLTQAILTPDFAAPEQFRRDPATVATDIYALGGLLYELLAGVGAWRRGGSGASGLARMISDDPPLPSKAAIGTGANTANPPVAAGRIAGDLDAIVAKAMRHDPDARYASVATLADDIRRHLAFEPVQARRGTFGYQLRRFVRRHRAATTAAAAAVLALVAGVVGIAWQARLVAAERDIARAQARRAEAVNEAVALMFRNAQEDGKGGSTSAKDLLAGSAARLVQSFGTHAPDTAPVVIALAELDLEVNDVVGAQTLLSTALAKGVGRDDPVAYARLQSTLGTVEGATGQLDEATRLLDAGDRMWRTDPARFRKDRLEAGAARAQILRQQGQRDAAIALLTRQLPEAEAEYADDPRSLLIRYNNLAVHLVEANRLNELDAVLKRGERVVRQFHQERSRMALSLLQLRGGWYARRDDPTAALAIFEQAAGQRRAIYGPSMALSADLMQVGRTLLNLGRVDRALPVLTEAHAMAIQYTGATAPVTLMAAMTLSEAHAQQGNVQAARALLRSVEPGLAPLGNANILYGAYLAARSHLEQAEGKLVPAQADLDAAAAVFTALGPAAEPFSKDIPRRRADLAKARAQLGHSAIS